MTIAPLSIPQGPQRIVCLTEETTEWLYLLGQEGCIVGISGYTVRPRRAREEKPKVSAFLSAKIDRILDLKPDCVFGFSDLQADIAAELVRKGVQVTIFNQRSVEDIFSMLYQVAAMVGPGAAGTAYIPGLADFVPMVKGTSSIAIGGPYLVESVVGEKVTEEDLGGSKVHNELSGVADAE